MEIDQIGAYAIQFVVTLSLSIGWLIICRLLRSVRVRIAVTPAYQVAAAIALLGPLISGGGPTWPGLITSLLVMALLYLGWKRSLTKQCMDTDTIIGFDTPVIR